MRFNCKKKAFTLAEVIITLSIIGVVVSITIPTLIDKNLTEQRKNGVKAAYSIISRMITTLQKDNGGTIRGICDSNDNICIKNAIKPYTSFIADCDDNVIANGCWKTEQYMDGTTATIDGSAIVLNNGMFLLFKWINGNCTNPGNDACGSITVDINGAKLPNKWGMDTFSYHILENTVKPYGVSGDNENMGSCKLADTGVNSGLGCTIKYLTEND